MHTAHAVAQHTVLSSSPALPLVLMDHCAIVWFDCADSYMPLFP